MSPPPHSASAAAVRSEPTDAPLTARRHVVLIGNPNVGKTTLFNRLTHEDAPVGNYPGVTVERRSAELAGRAPGAGSASVEVVDVPGTYSLSARSAEEQIAVAAVAGIFEHARPDLVVAVVDAGQLIRNLYLVTQLLELGAPTVIALNMIDEVTDHPPNPEAIGKFFGVPCIATQATTGRGLEELRAAIWNALAAPPRPRIDVPYPESVRQAVDRVAEVLPPKWRRDVERDRALARWALTSIDADDELRGIPDQLRASVLAEREREPKGDLDAELIQARYAFLDAQADKFFGRTTERERKPRFGEQLDRVLLHPVFGFFAFLLAMLIVFQALFTWSDPAIGAIETLFGKLGEWARVLLPEGLLRDLVVEGVIAGVGNVVVFLPQILLLFFFIGLLEDSGYMARIAYLMDRVMRSLGLHGRAFVPMLSGFACAVPAILSTRTMERQRDRLLTMLVVPLMTCSARLPVYTLIIAALFPASSLWGWMPVQGLLMIAMYLFSIVVSLIVAAVLGRTVVRGKRVGLILELPPYRLPRVGATLRMMWQRARSFLKEAGTVILVCTIALWALLTFPRAEASTATASPDVALDSAPGLEATSNSAAPQAAEAAADSDVEAARAIENSYAGRIGKAMEPLVAPLGFDWKIAVGILGAFAAREVFVSTLGIVYGIEAEDDDSPLRERIARERLPDGSPRYTPLMGLSLMVFFALGCQCVSTLAVVKRETASYRWPAFLFGYMTLLAYGASLLVYQVGSLLGF